MLILPITKDFNKLLENSSLTTITTLGKLGRIMIVAVNLAIVLVVGVLSTKDGWANRTCKVFNVVFAIESSDVGTPQSSAAFVT